MRPKLKENDMTKHAVMSPDGKYVFQRPEKKNKQIELSIEHQRGKDV